MLFHLRWSCIYSIQQLDLRVSTMSMSNDSTMSMSSKATMRTMSSNSTMMSFVSHLSNIALKVIGVVLDMLDPAVGKVDRVMSLSGSGPIAMLLLIKTGASVAVCNRIVVVIRNYLMDFMSISMANSVTSMSASMTSMPKTSMANARASMVTNRSMSSTEATDLGRGDDEEGRDANEDLHSVNCLPILPC